jgi:hypothetical protein
MWLTDITVRLPLPLWGMRRKPLILIIPGMRNTIFSLPFTFPDDQLNIIDYNRVVKDLNGLMKRVFLRRLE